MPFNYPQISSKLILLACMAIAEGSVGQNPEDDFVMVEQEDLSVEEETKDYLDSISTHIEGLSHDLRHISLSIHDNPELQFKEYHAHHVLTEYLKKQDGWRVTPSAYDIKTAFVAVYDSGTDGPVVSFNAEYGATQSS